MAKLKITLANGSVDEYKDAAADFDAGVLTVESDDASIAYAIGAWVKVVSTD